MTQDASHKQINSNHNLPLLKVPTGQIYSANLYGEDASNSQIISKTPAHYKLDAKVAGADVDVYIAKSQTDNLVANTTITTPTIIAQTLRSKQANSEILLKSYNDLSQIRFIPGALNYIQSSTNVLSFSKFGDSAVQLSIDHNASSVHTTGSVVSNYNISIRPPSGNLNFNLFRLLFSLTRRKQHFYCDKIPAAVLLI
jgi:hypothetical protein